MILRRVVVCLAGGSLLAGPAPTGGTMTCVDVYTGSYTALSGTCT